MRWIMASLRLMADRDTAGNPKGSLSASTALPLLQARRILAKLAKAGDSKGPPPTSIPPPLLRN
jgi:hypothetical protein